MNTTCYIKFAPLQDWLAVLLEKGTLSVWKEATLYKIVEQTVKMWVELQWEMRLVMARVLVDHKAMWDDTSGSETIEES